LINSESGAAASPISMSATSPRKSPVRCPPISVDGGLHADDWMEPKEQRKVDPFILYGVAAADHGA
jgi:3-oxoacyl-(acyl-carrier-protein) synthase